MSLFHLLLPKTVLRIVSANIWKSVQLLNQNGISVYNMVQKDALTFDIELHRSNTDPIIPILEKQGDRVTIQHRSGIRYSILQMRKRPVLVFGLCMILCTLVILPGRILFVEVLGNQNVPARKILESAQKANIELWAKRKNIRSEHVKNQLLFDIPELQWAGINTYGCRAVISVRERVEKEYTEPVQQPACSIYAERDGVILSMSVLQGTAQCEIGKTVKRGELLVSGYTDHGLCIRASNAEAEIFAQTMRQQNAVTPTAYLSKMQPVRSDMHISVCIGKKRINLWKGSGIWDSSCDRISMEYHLTLPGGYRLPLSICFEKLSLYHRAEASLDAASVYSFLHEMTQHYICNQMVAGQIVAASVSQSTSGDYAYLHGIYNCVEMIGRKHFEEIGDLYGKNR